MEKPAEKILRFPDFEKARQTMISLRAMALKLKQSQPDCKILGDKYDEVFIVYGQDLDELDEQRREVLEEASKVLDTGKYSEWTEHDYEEYQVGAKALLEKWDQLKAKGQKLSYKTMYYEFEALVNRFKAISREFNENQLEESREYLKELNALDAVLKKLSKSTHNWIPVEWMKVTVDHGRTTGAEGSLKGRASIASTIVTKLRCTRCSQEKDAQPAV